MLIVMPSDPTTEKASEYLNSQGIEHQVIEIPEDLGYKTSANIGLYLVNQDHLDKIMLDMSAQGLVIMRVFKEFVLT